MSARKNSAPYYGFFWHRMVGTQRRPNMIGGIVIVIGLLFFGAQFMDATSTVSLASEFHIPENYEFTRWATLDRPVRAVVHDIPLGSLLLVVGGGIYWISNWLNEKLGCQFEAAPSRPANETAPSTPSAPIIQPTPSAPAIHDRKSGRGS